VIDYKANCQYIIIIALNRKYEHRKGNEVSSTSRNCFSVFAVATFFSCTATCELALYKYFNNNNKLNNNYNNNYNNNNNRYVFVVQRFLSYLLLRPVWSV